MIKEAEEYWNWEYKVWREADEAKLGIWPKEINQEYLQLLKTQENDGEQS